MEKKNHVNKFIKTYDWAYEKKLMIILMIVCNVI